MGSATAKRIALPEDFPWQQSVGLLLDAVQVEKLLPRLFEWAEIPRVDVLYLTTRLAEFRDLSPVSCPPEKCRRSDACAVPG